MCVCVYVYIHIYIYIYIHTHHPRVPDTPVSLFGQLTIGAIHCRRSALQLVCVDVMKLWNVGTSNHTDGVVRYHLSRDRRIYIDSMVSSGSGLKTVHALGGARDSRFNVLKPTT